jgi:hypothetical protein
MVQLAEPEAPATIDASINYYLDNGEKPYTYTGGPGSTDLRSSTTADPHRVAMHNGRPFVDRFALERDGFHFVPHDTKVQSFFEEDESAASLSGEEALGRPRAGPRVAVFDHTLRTADDAEREQRKIREGPARPQTTTPSGPAAARARSLPPEEWRAVAPALRHIQVWRPIRHPVETFTAICDAKSVSSDDFVISERRYPNRVGQTYAVKYNPAHRWYWFPRMRRDEALVFKVYDSLADGRARWTAHTAFDDPTAPANARPRESIEIRTFAFF